MPLSLFTFMHWRRKWQPTPVFLPGECQGWGSLVGCCLWGHTELDTTGRLHFHFSLSCIGEGNGNPLQCSCLENARDGGAWWAAVYSVAQSRTQLKQLSSSSSSRVPSYFLSIPIQLSPTIKCGFFLVCFWYISLWLVFGGERKNTSWVCLPRCNGKTRAWHDT